MNEPPSTPYAEHASVSIFEQAFRARRIGSMTHIRLLARMTAAVLLLLTNGGRAAAQNARREARLAERGGAREEASGGFERRQADGHLGIRTHARVRRIRWS